MTKKKGTLQYDRESGGSTSILTMGNIMEDCTVESAWTSG